VTKGVPRVSEQEQQEMFEKAKAAYPEAYDDPRRRGIHWQLQDPFPFTEEVKYAQKLILVQWHDDHNNVTGGESIRRKSACQDRRGEYYSVDPDSLSTIS